METTRAAWKQTSWRPSSKNSMNSSASCCRKPENLLCFIASNVYNHHTTHAASSFENQYRYYPLETLPLSRFSTYFQFVFSLIFLFVACGGLSWLHVSFLLHVKHTVSWLVAWHSGRTLVFDRRTFPVLRLICSWRVTTYVGKPSAIGQPTRPTQPFILLGR